MSQRIYNFNAGPSALPLPVLKEAQKEFLDFKGTGMSILEISHRAPAFDEVLNDAVTNMGSLLGLNGSHRVLFLQGGASTQFYQVVMNLHSPGGTADYIDTGTWSTKAIKEARVLGRKVNVAATSEDRNYCYIPQALNLTPHAEYVHITSNNTIKGTQWNKFPVTGGIPLVADMSSDIISRPIDADSFGLIYAGAQKNLGPAGVTLVVIREDMLDRVPDNLPSMISYRTHAEKNSTYNTPPCFSIYIVGLTLKWIMKTFPGGLKDVEKFNRKKAGLLYDYMDKSDFYSATADKDSRSMMNVTFRLVNEDLEKKFVADSLKNGLGGLKGHRSVGGCRASIYNAVPMEAVQALVDFMKEFAKKNG